MLTLVVSNWLSVPIKCIVTVSPTFGLSYLSIMEWFCAISTSFFFYIFQSDSADWWKMHEAAKWRLYIRRSVLETTKYKGQKESNMKHNLLASQYYMNVRKLVLMSCTISFKSRSFLKENDYMWSCKKTNRNMQVLFF